MRKLIVFASALALSGSIAFAMEEEAMDEEMMMEAPAPSVALGGSAKIGVKNVDDDKMPDAESITLVRAYKVTFSSSGTTDGGLVFGAGMSIRDDTGEEDAPVVKGSHVYVGGGDGSWKLQFGGNDPGALLAGGIGFADDRIDRGDADVSLSGSMQGIEYRVTMADPQLDSDDWSAGVKFSAGQIGVGLGMDSEDGLAIGMTTDFSGLSTSVYYATSESKESVDRPIAAVPASFMESIADARSDANDDDLLDAGDVVYTYHVPTVQGNAGYGTDATREETVTVTYEAETADGPGGVTGIDDDTTLTGGRTVEVEDGYLVITQTDSDPATAGDQSLVVARYMLTPDEGTGTAATTMATVAAGDWTGLGASVTIPAGDGASIIVGYSQQEKKISVVDGPSGSATSKRFELDFTYDLGGGATFKAGIDKDDTEELMAVSGDTDEDYTLSAKASDKTTLEASVSFSF
ncbi:MAG: hypothetical protein F4073_09380 [Rhodobacteraceae bacterium]|nr:hypothetical protein [Paracoccaceae bacterium]MYF46378.1 hypothetical protein [Paracoccaceae bacterium]MYI92151.1 hypothetical protein [Paracoccaceae bacterium]